MLLAVIVLALISLVLSYVCVWQASARTWQRKWMRRTSENMTMASKVLTDALARNSELAAALAEMSRRERRNDGAALAAAAVENLRAVVESAGATGGKQEGANGGRAGFVQ